MNPMTNGLTTMRGWLGWLPDPVVSVLIVLVAVAVALVIHRLLGNLARRSFERRNLPPAQLFACATDVTPAV